MQSATDPGILERVVSDAIAAAKAKNGSRAFELVNAALGDGARHPALFSIRAELCMERGRYFEALSDFESASVLAPRNPALRIAIGNCNLKLTEWRKALLAFDSAIAAAPNMALPHYRRGLALQMIGDIGAARDAHARAVALKPDFADAIGSLALMSIGRQNASEARSFAARALTYNSRQPTALIALAMADFSEGLVAAAEENIRAILQHAQFGDDPQANNVLGILADLADRHDNVALAFAVYTALQERRWQIHAPRFANFRAADTVDRLKQYFAGTPAWNPSKRAARGHGDPAGHAFLLGFARSGTTLLESALASNKQVVALDERDCLPRAAKDLLNDTTGLDRLAAMDGEDLTQWREEYWRSVRGYGLSVAGKVFVDKWPFNSYRLPLLSRLFPEAKILFALRDPRDVVFSCFRHRFVVNADTFELLSLHDCARFYSGIMSLVEVLRKRLPLRLLEHRYEGMVANFDAAMRTVCEFLEIRWSEGMRDFAHAADSTIDPLGQSRQQVKLGLYAGAVGQWRRYEQQFAPVLPIIQPWVERFGYAAGQTSAAPGRIGESLPAAAWQE
ncbi:MAG TPA: sulfotransferase [Rhizomicrobium sp.]|jgi:tetratricopeptide (TPR) repeat protein